MGRAQIISETGEGLYTIEVKHDQAAAAAQIAWVDETIANVETLLEEAETAIEGAGESDDLAALNKQKAWLTLRLTVLNKRRDWLENNIPSDYQAQAWCADLTTGLTGEVATIEPAAEYKNGINIRPGWDDGAAWNQADHGYATPFATLPVADAMRNFCLMPAIQKHRPTYRYGTITSLDTENDQCTVSLDAVVSSIQNLDVNRSSVLSDVPIDYMSCNAAAFGTGDRVIVKFGGDWSNPTVIGFVSEPKPCGWVEPWDGPLLTSLWPWAHSWEAHNQGGYTTGDLSTAVINDGQLEIDIAALPSGEQWIDHTHQWTYDPSATIQENASRVIFCATAMLDCYPSVPAPFLHIYKLILFGKKDAAEVQFHIRVVCNRSWDLGHIGCIGYEYEETDWLYGTVDLATGWHKNILNEKMDWIILPVTGVDIKKVIVHMEIVWNSIVSLPDDFESAWMDIDHIAIS